jgi:hypothetical protein
MDMSRRSFIRNASLSVAAAGTAATVAPGLLGLGGAAAPEVTTLVDEGGAAAVDGPVVAHVVDASSGTVAVYHGVREVIVQSPSLVSALTAALR